MFDSTKSQRDDLRFLLKDKYHFDETQISKAKENTEDLSEEIKKDIELLKSGYPLDYIIGYIDFLNLKIDLSYKPLIPRIETEYWTEQVINSLDKNKEYKVLDIFCGSGCIGLTILKAFPNATCTFADINKDFLNQTKKNAELNNISLEKIKFIESDVFENIDGKFDLIVANPPYVSKNDKVGEGVEHEPQGAVFANDNGLELIEKFLKDGKDFLNSDGMIYMEFGENQKNEIEKLLNKFGYKNWDFKKDQFGKDRYFKASSKT